MNIRTDDLLASIAARRKGRVLSQNNAFLCFEPRVEVVTGWIVNEASGAAPTLELLPVSETKRAHILRKDREARRPVDGTLADREAALSDAAPPGVGLSSALKYLHEGRARGRVERGASSSSDSRLGNLHALAAPLREALYARLRQDEVEEVIPSWDADAGAVVWTETIVYADPDSPLDFLLDDAHELAKWLGEKDADCAAAWGPESREVGWRTRERAFSRCALAAELVSAASFVSAEPRSLLQILRSFPEYAAAPSVDLETLAVPHSIPSKKAPGAVVYTKECVDCGQAFGLTAALIDALITKHGKLPIKCKPCFKKAQREQASPPPADD